jgi:DNA-binding CsgD family transcriptional regulator
MYHETMAANIPLSSMYATVREQDQRRVPREERKTYDIKQMWQRHHEIVNLAAQGFKQVEIAEILNIHPQTVSNTLNSTLGEEKLEVLRTERDEDVRKTVEKVRVLKDKALKIYHTILDGVDENGNSVDISMRDRKDVADTVLLELSGLRVPTKIQSSNITMTATELEELKQRGIQTMRESGLIIDAEVVKNE